MTESHRLVRRDFLGGALAAVPMALVGQSVHAPASAAVNVVRAGEDRLGEHHTIGVSTTAFKVLTGDSSGGLFIFEHASRKKGGPPRHLHHNEDEWFYVVEGQYLVEIGSVRIQLNIGDSVLGPREVPHAWAFIGDTPGRLLVAFAPANKMEAYFRYTEKLRKGNEYTTDAEIFRAYGMELLGPPLSTS
jgi:mannose-6-phosphate isomerase-like protein (cupin superfamily)